MNVSGIKLDSLIDETSECEDKIFSISEVPDLGIPKIKILLLPELFFL